MTTHEKKKRRKKCQERKKLKFVRVRNKLFKGHIHKRERAREKRKCEKEFFLSPYVKRKKRYQLYKFALLKY